MKTVKIKEIANITKNAILHFTSNNPFNLAASTAFFALFSLAPMLIIIISIFGFFVSNNAAKDEIMAQINNSVGEQSAEFLNTAIQNYQIVEHSTTGAIVGFIVFFVSATTLFSAIKESINYIWRVKPKDDIKRGLLKLLLNRLFSFAVILSIVVVMLLSFLVDVSTDFLHEFLEHQFSPKLIVLAKWINYIFSLSITVSIFMLVYKLLPDVKVKWTAAFYGTIITTALFLLGSYFIRLIIENSNLGAVYGTASSLIMILLWIYYVSIIFYFGVELCRQYSLYYKHENTPGKFTTTFKITTKST